jgi:hypothetical protein
MYWEEQIKTFLEDEKRLAELLEENNALESLKNVEDIIVRYNHNFGRITGYIKFEEVEELDDDEQAEESEEYLYQYMKRTNELSSEIKKLQKRLKKMREDWLEELGDLPEF